MACYNVGRYASEPSIESLFRMFKINLNPKEIEEFEELEARVLRKIKNLETQITELKWKVDSPQWGA